MALLPLLFLLCASLFNLCQTSNTTSLNPAIVNTNTSTIGMQVQGCDTDLDPIYRFLCDRQAAWGIILEILTSGGFLFTAVFLIGLLFWFLCTCVSSRRPRHIGGVVLCLVMFLLATAGIFALTFSFIISLTPRTCPTRIFLFNVLFSMALSCLVARCLAALGFAAARGWGEPAVALGLSLVQVIISAQWLLTVLVRDKNPCEYSQEEFVMLQIYVLCLLAVGLILSLRVMCRSCLTYSYSYTGATNQQWRIQAFLLFFTLLVSSFIWVVWITMMIWGNPKLGRRPSWDDPVLSITLVANGWVLLLGHGLSQISFFCRGEAMSKDDPLSFAGWISPNADMPGLESQKEGRDNGSFEQEAENKRGRRTEPKLQSPYESEFSMMEIDPNKDYSIPRPQTTDYNQPYDGYYGPSK